MDLDVERGWVDPKEKQGGWWGWSRNKEEEGMCEPERSPCGEGPRVSSYAGLPRVQLTVQPGLCQNNQNNVGVAQVRMPFYPGF